jgi:dephospho-CoA kinase
MTSRPIFIGLTGGIATGKSTVADALKEHGAAVISCDAIAHRLIRKGSPLYKIIVSKFGTSILDTNGRIDRRRLGRSVFNKPPLRKKLEGLLHPAIWREVLLAKQKAGRDGKKVFVAEVPLLFEAGLDRHVDLSIVTFCSEADQVRRAKHSLGLTKKEALARIRSQMSLLEKRARADFILDTSGSKIQSRARTYSLLSLILMTERLFT